MPETAACKTKLARSGIKLTFVEPILLVPLIVIEEPVIGVVPFLSSNVLEFPVPGAVSKTTVIVPLKQPNAWALAVRPVSVA